MAGSTGLEPATSGLTERDAAEPSVRSKWRNSFSSFADHPTSRPVVLLDIVGENGGRFETRKARSRAKSASWCERPVPVAPSVAEDAMHPIEAHDAIVPDRRSIPGADRSFLPLLRLRADRPPHHDQPRSREPGGALDRFRRLHVVGEATVDAEAVLAHLGA